MAIVITQTATAVSPGINASFLASGGTGSIVYSILAGGAGGTIDSSTGVYTAPSGIPTTPQTSVDTIQAKDSLNITATASILVCTALELVCDILQNQLSQPPMNLGIGRCYLFDQKINEPIDHDPWIAVSLLTSKPFGNNITYVNQSGFSSIQSVNMQSTVTIDIISRGPAARDLKEFILIALMSTYSERQQEANSFYISRIPTQFINLSGIDGTAIPYRYQISVQMQYTVTNEQTVPWFSDFSTPPSILVNS